MLDQQELESRIRRFLGRKNRQFPNLEYEFNSSFDGDESDEAN